MFCYKSTAPKSNDSVLTERHGQLYECTAPYIQIKIEDKKEEILLYLDHQDKVWSEILHTSGSWPLLWLPLHVKRVITTEENI